MRNIKNFKNQVREAFIVELETLNTGPFSDFGFFEDWVLYRMFNIGEEIAPQYFPDGKLSNEAALAYYMAMPELLDADFQASTPSDNIAPAMISVTAGQLLEELDTVLRQKFEALGAVAPKP